MARRRGRQTTVTVRWQKQVFIHTRLSRAYLALAIGFLVKICFITYRRRLLRVPIRTWQIFSGPCHEFSELTRHWRPEVAMGVRHWGDPHLQWRMIWATPSQNLLTFPLGWCINPPIASGGDLYYRGPRPGFYQRDAMLARFFATSMCLSVCPSVCLSRAGIVSKWRKL